MDYFIAILFHFCFLTFLVSNATITNGGGMIQSQTANHVPSTNFHNVFHAAKSVTNHAANSLRNWGGQNLEGVNMHKNVNKVDQQDSGSRHDSDPEDLAENSFKRKIGVILLSIFAAANLQSIPLAIKYAVGNQNGGHNQIVTPENNLIKCQPFYGQFACYMKIPLPSKEYLEKYGMLELYADIDGHPDHMEQIADIDLNSCERSSKIPENVPHIQHELKNKIIANRGNQSKYFEHEKHNDKEEILCEKIVEINEKQLEKIIKKNPIPKDKKVNNEKDKNDNDKIAKHLDKRNRQMLQNVLNDITNEDGMIQSQKADNGNSILHRHSRKLLNWWGKKNDEPKHSIQVQKRKFVADMEEFQKFVTWKNEINPTGEKKAQPSWSYDYGGRKIKTKQHPPETSENSIAQPPENSDNDTDGPSSDDSDDAPGPNGDYDFIKIFKSVSWRGILTFNLLLNSAPNEVYIRNNNVFQGVQDPIWCHPFGEQFKCTIELYPKELGVDPKSPLEIFMDLKGDYVTVQKMAEIDISECKSTGKSIDGKDVKESEGLAIIPEEYGKVLPEENPEKFITD